MNKVILLSLLCFAIVLHPATSLSQTPQQMPGINAPIDMEKLYLHTDRQYYFQGDTLRFKGYYLNGQTQRLDPGYCNMYLDLINDAGNILLSQMYSLEKGLTMGQVPLSDNLKPGSYFLRAYTDRQKQIGEDAFFHLSFQLSKIQSTLDQPAASVREANFLELDLAFLPEGGYLLEGVLNTVGIKVVGSSGKNLQVEGEIRDEEDKTVANFHTAYQGMDTLRFRPERGKRYHIVLVNHPQFTYTIDDVKKRGIKLECIGENDKEFLFRVTSNAPTFNGKYYVFAIMHRGSLLYEQEFVLKNSEFPIKVDREALPAGINRLILLDASLTPLSERLFFSPNPVVNHIRIESDQYAYNTRSPVEIRLSDEEVLGGMGWSSLSMSVVNEHAVEKNGSKLDILSWLLIDSELKGVIESPSDFFVDNSGLSSSEKLNLLMLTQGWSRYLWNTLPEEEPEYEVWRADGITLSGNVRKAMSKKPVQNGLVNCTLYGQHGFMSESTSTDVKGNFLFPDLFFTDTAALFIQGFNQKGKLYTEVFLDPLHEKSTGVSPGYLPTKTRFDDFPVSLYQQQYYNDVALRDYLIASGSILLEEVSITRKYTPPADGHYRIYSKPSTSFKLTEKDLMYNNVEQYIQAKLGALAYSLRNSFTENSSSHLVLLNMIETEWDIVKTIPISDVDEVDYIKQYDNAAYIFGVRGGNGVISVFTKKGGDQFVRTYVQGTVSKRITGFSAYREFYYPKYTPENLSSEKPDWRITLHWDPDILTADGKAVVSFYTSDDISRYRIMVEGITSTGEVCLGSSEFVVSGDHAGLATH